MEGKDEAVAASALEGRSGDEWGGGDITHPLISRHSSPAPKPLVTSVSSAE